MLFRHLRAFLSVALAVALLSVFGAASLPGFVRAESSVANSQPMAGESAALPCPPVSPYPIPTPPWCHTQPATVSAGDICLRLAAQPAGDLRPAAVVSYQLIAHNSGNADIGGVQITLPFSQTTQTPIDAAFTNPTAWVSAIRPNEVEIHLGPLLPAETVTATLWLQTSPAVAEGSLLSTRAHLEWSSERQSGSGTSNRLALVVGQATAGSPTMPLKIVPEAGASMTTFIATYDGFASYERVSLWYHRPDGRAVALEGIQAGAEGQISVSFSAAQTSGRYTLVAHGQCSQVSAVGMFLVTAASS